MAQRKLTILCPLFDTIEQLNSPMPSCCAQYIDNLSVNNAHKEHRLSLEFLKSYAGSADTFNAYRREVERFLHWCWQVEQKNLTEIGRNEIRDYLEFARTPPTSWISTKNVRRFLVNKSGERVRNPDWRPFVIRLPKSQKHSALEPDPKHYSLGDKSMQAMMASLSTYFAFLQQEEYLDRNPVQLVRQKSRFIKRNQTVKVTRKLSELQWQYVIETVKVMADDSQEYERSYFMMSAFFLLGLRISELAETPGRSPEMGHFAPDKHGLWWFTTVGKGNKVRDIAVPDVMLDILKRYRVSRSLPPLPARGESNPIMHKTRGHGGLGTRQIRNLVQKCFDLAVKRLEKAGKSDEAADLQVATVHWLRHTSISMDIEFRPREHVRDDAGHESAATTEQYIDADRRARHASARGKTLNPHQNQSLKDETE